jgi:ribonuclease HII
MPLDKKPIKGVRDSKTLNAAQRERLAKLILRRATRIGIGAASVREIDTINIYHATVLAMKRAVTRAGEHDFVIVDGNRIRGFEEHAGPYRSVIDGDALCYVVACASIVAKVTRDRLMTRLAARYPGYGWEHNAGYATADHRAGMAALGVTPHHRRSFITTQRVLAGEQTSFDLFPVLDTVVEVPVPA